MSNRIEALTIQRDPKNIGWQLVRPDGRIFYHRNFCFQQDAQSFITQLSERQGYSIRVTIDCRNPQDRTMLQGAS